MATLPERLSAVPAGRGTMPREIVAMHQRQSVCEAAIDVFAKRGFQGTRIRHIIAAAKVGVGKFYELFDNKEDCFLACYEMIVAGARQTIEAQVPSEGGWPERVCATLTALLRQVEAEPLRARLAIAEAPTAGPAALARYEETVLSLIPLISAGRALSPRAAELPSTLEEATIAGTAWLLHQRLAMGESSGLIELFPELVEIVLGPYLGEQQAASLAREFPVAAA